MGLKVALYQMDVAWCDKEANLAKAKEYVYSVDADIVVLPETFVTGFKTTSASFAEEADGATAQWFRKTAMDSGKAIVGSTMIKEYGADGNEIYYNRLFFAKPDGEMAGYDKRHLFSFGGENRFFSRGKDKLIVEYKGVRILTLVCYDLRFPVFSRYRGDYDMIIYIASWDDSRIGVWDILLKARAVENQCYVIGVNRVGRDPFGTYEGHTVAVNYYGEILAAVPDNTEAGVVVDIDLAPMIHYREKFRAWEDADDFTLNIK